MKKIGIIIGVSIIFLIGISFIIGNKTEIKKDIVQEELEDKSPLEEITVHVDGTVAPGYSLSQKTVKKGSRVRLNFVTNNEQGCARAITIPSKNVRQVLPESGLTPVEFIADKEGSLEILCDMGMYFVTLNVV